METYGQWLHYFKKLYCYQISTQKPLGFEIKNNTKEWNSNMYFPFTSYQADIFFRSFVARQDLDSVVPQLGA